ncbi:MAG: Na(+)-translocating NADH-quinone reductase subunit A [Cohaesibacteraceae bacterium]|nr:Na(+)-translocating NADH-quinone reductase subunit A [Cohaesibacteraceae bacterium]
MKLKKGLDLPMTGTPDQTVSAGPKIKTVAINGQDFEGLKPKMLVAEGDLVKKGQPLFVHKEAPNVNYVAPGGGKITALNRGPRRVLETIIITLDSKEESVAFDKTSPDGLMDLSREAVQNQLYKSGMWTSFRTRPWSRVPLEGDVPAAIFVTAMDTDPLAADAGVVIAASAEAFSHGLDVISKLTDGALYVCHGVGKDLPTTRATNAQYHCFEGPHPAGLAGTHIHFLEPVSEQRKAWSLGYQDVISIGALFTSGELHVDRTISLSGPRANNPRLITTRTGASLDEICAGEITESDAECRRVSGSVLSGSIAHDQFAYLGRYHRQITLMEEDTRQRLLGWINPGTQNYSFLNVHLSSFLRKARKFAFGTNINGGRRAMVPLGTYERVMPMDIMATQLLRSILVLDTDQAQKLGVLELDEEDLALCTFVCHSKYEYGEALRASLQKIEKEG